MVIREASDVHGDAVNVAARITEVAAGTPRSSRLMPRLTRCRRIWSTGRGHIRRASHQGAGRRSSDLFNIQMEDRRQRQRPHRQPGPAQTRRPAGATDPAPPRSAIHGGRPEHDRHPRPRRGLLDRDSQRFRRGPACNRRMPAPANFFISDRSASGTYIQFSGGDKVHIVGEDTMLRAAPVPSSWGGRFSEDPAGIIEFSVHLAPASA